MTASQETEAVKLVRVLASYACTGQHSKEVSCDAATSKRQEMCGLCNAYAFLRDLKQ